MEADELIARYFLSRSAYWRATLEELDVETVNMLIDVLETVLADINIRLAAESELLVDMPDFNRDRDRAAREWIYDVLSSARERIADAVGEASVISAGASISAWNSMLSFDGKAAAVNIVGLTQAQILSWFRDTVLGSGGLEYWVDKIFEDGVQKELLFALRRIGIEGKGISDAVQRILLAASNAGFAITRREAITLARTFIQTANIRAQEMVFKANEHLLKGYRRIETLDNKCCMLCVWSDGAFYNLDEPRPKLPSHPNCRGLYIPVAKSWRDFGINIDELEAVARPWVIREQGSIDEGLRLKIKNYGKTTENYSGWWKSLSSEEKAQTAIGPVRRKLLEDGIVSWKEMWDKATGRPKTLKELGFDQRGNRLS